MRRGASPKAISSRRRIQIAAALIVAAGLAAYSNSFTNLWVGLDGKQSIRDNPHIRRLWPLSEAISLPLWRSSLIAEETPTVAYRPTFSLTLALTHHLFGLQPQAFHGVNLAIHIAAALALFGIVRRTLERQGFDARAPGRSVWLALLTALIWLVHPLQTESVTYVVQICETLMGLFFLLTMYGAIRSLEGDNRRWWQAAAITSFGLSAGAKQTTPFAPLLVCLYDYTFVAGPKGEWRRPGFYAALAIPFAIVFMPFFVRGSQSVNPEYTVAYALAQPGVILHYLRLSLWPDELYLYVNTDLFAVGSLSEALLPTAILLTLAGLTIWGILRRRWFGFLGAFFFLSLGPTSSILPITDRIQEHRMYLPLAAVAVLAVVAGDHLLHAALATRLPSRSRQLIGVALSSAIVLGLGTRTHIRNWDYHHELAMYHPADLHGIYVVLAQHYLSNDRLLREEVEKARRTLDTPGADRREISLAHFVLAMAHQHDGDLPAAKGEYLRLLELEPQFAFVHRELGLILQAEGDLAGAMQHFDEAIRINPNFVDAFKEQALAFKEKGDIAKARELLERSLGIDAGFGEGHYELGMMALERQDSDDALNHFRQAVRDRPDLAAAHFELAMLLDDRGDKAGAIESLQAAVNLSPGLEDDHLADALYQLAVNLADARQFAAAEKYLRRLLDIRPDDRDAAELLTSIRRENDR